MLPFYFNINFTLTITSEGATDPPPPPRELTDKRDLSKGNVATAYKKLRLETNRDILRHFFNLLV